MNLLFLNIKASIISFPNLLILVSWDSIKFRLEFFNSYQMLDYLDFVNKNYFI